jgi:hypothetical protein
MNGNEPFTYLPSHRHVDNPHTVNRLFHLIGLLQVGSADQAAVYPAFVPLKEDLACWHLDVFLSFNSQYKYILQNCDCYH